MLRGKMPLTFQQKAFTIESDRSLQLNKIDDKGSLYDRLRGSYELRPIT